MSSPACRRTAAMRRIGISAMVMNMEMRRVERKTIKSVVHHRGTEVTEKSSVLFHCR
jgi:hypothetical protein